MHAIVFVAMGDDNQYAFCILLCMYVVLVSHIKCNGGNVLVTCNMLADDDDDDSGIDFEL